VTRRAVVVGAGVVGVASSYYLQSSGWEVTLIDRGEVGRGCSYGNACLIVPSHSQPLPGPGVIGQALRWMLRSDSPFYIRPRFDPGLLRWAWQFRRHCTREAAEKGARALLALSRLSLELYQEIVESGEASFFFERRGCLEAYFSAEGCEEGRKERDALVAQGFRARLLAREEALSFEPALAPAVRGALFVEGEAHGFSYGYARSLASTVQHRGARILTGRPVARILRSSGRVSGVALENPAEDVEADVVVLAAGSWSAALARTVGVGLPLQPAKGYSSTIDTFSWAPRIPILIHGTRVIITPLGDRLRFGGTLELAGFEDGIDRTRYDAVVRAAREALRESFPMANEERWCGLRPVTPDGLPIIDRAAQMKGLIVATGHAMLGLTQSPATGRLVAQLANGEEPSLPLAPFRLDRFG
jgi:D-amino-acid dehydrogenase